MSQFSFGVVVRSSGERTTDSCRNICGNLPGVADCRMVTEAPFEKALRKSFVEALDIGADWTLMIDADVLLKPACIRMMSAATSQAGENCFQLQWKVLDKLFDLPRNGRPWKLKGT